MTIRSPHADTCRCRTCEKRRIRCERYDKGLCRDCPKTRDPGRSRCSSCASVNRERLARRRHPERYLDKPEPVQRWGRLIRYQCSFCREFGHTRPKCPRRREEALAKARKLTVAA